MSASEQRKAILESFRMPKASISELNIKSEGKQLFFNMEATSTGYGRVSGSRIFIPFSIHPYPALRNPKEQAHVIDLENVGYTSTDSITMVLPEGYAIESVPKTQVVMSEFGSYTLESQVEGNEVKLVTTFKIKSGVYSAELFEQWVAFRKAVSSACNGTVIIKNSSFAFAQLDGY